jgi:hypothetical protein
MRMHLRTAALLALLAAPAFAQDRIPAGERPDPSFCPAGGPLMVWLTEQSSVTDCDATGSGSVDALCCCVNSAWSACASGGGGSGNSFETINLPAGTDPVADSGTDTLNVTCIGPLTCTGNSGTDTWALAWSGAFADAQVDGTLEEDELEPVLDLQDLQGAVTDGQVPNNITISLAATATAAASNGSNCAAGTYGGFAAGIDASFDGEGCGLVRPYSYLLDVKPGIAGTPDDDFSSSTLDPKWTAVSGSLASVNLLETGATVQEYDLTTRPGWLLVQVGRNASQNVRLRQDYTLPDGNSIVLAIAANTGSTATAAGNNFFQISFAVNQDDTTIRTAPYLEVFVDSQASDPSRVYVSSNVGSDFTGPAVGSAGGLVYFRIARSGLAYAVFAATDGSTWMPLAHRTLASAATNVWIQVESTAAITGPIAPIAGVDWIRLGTNALDPW